MRAFLLALLLFPVALATHEVMHLVIFSAFGVKASLLVTQWHLGLTGTRIFGLHAAPAGDVPLNVLAINNGLGPSIAALLLLVLWLSVSPRSRAARSALLANVAVLLFFATIEVAYPLLEEAAHVRADFLLLPEFNYGVALALLAGVVAMSSGRPRPKGSVNTNASRLQHRSATGSVRS
jgi:hypothetical protein